MAIMLSQIIIISIKDIASKLNLKNKKLHQKFKNNCMQNIAIALKRDSFLGD